MYCHVLCGTVTHTFAHDRMHAKNDYDPASSFIDMWKMIADVMKTVDSYCLNFCADALVAIFCHKLVAGDVTTSPSCTQKCPPCLIGMLQYEMQERWLIGAPAPGGFEHANLYKTNRIMIFKH